MLDDVMFSTSEDVIVSIIMPEFVYLECGSSLIL